MNGKPLISYAIQNALQCKYIDDVVVSSDDEEILGISKAYGAMALERNSSLAQDAVTLDPVIYDAVCRMEEIKGVSYDIIITLQPTSPLLSINTLEEAIFDFMQSSYDTYISTVNKPHLSWTSTKDKYVPNYKERLNRQQLPPNYLETGAFLITRRLCVTENSRIGENISIYNMPEEEAIDIDCYTDWIICEHQLKKKRIILRVDGHESLGLGHIYRCLTLAYNLVGQDILFVTKEQYFQGYEKLKASHMPVKTISTDDDFYQLIDNWKPDVIINDCLNTTTEYIQTLKSKVNRVVTFEDVGNGAKYADAVINALYENKPQSDTYYGGKNYVCLRDEFLVASPSEFNNIVSKVTVLFGGSDPCDFTSRVYQLAKTVHQDYPNIEFTFILGPAYDNNLNLVKSLETCNINVVQDVKRVSDILKNSDLAFTSQGRTVYELAVMGVPAIVMAQNERETKHTFASMDNGFLNLGMGKNVTDETLLKVFKFLVDTPQIRQEMRSLMLHHDLKKGIGRVINIILQEN